MKQRLMLFGLMLMLVASGCRKEKAGELTGSNDQLAAKPGTSDNRLRQCRLVFSDRDGAYGNFFHYNLRGLVDEWKVDYYDGYPDVYQFTYDNFNRLKTGSVIFNSSGRSFDLKYLYQGNRLVKETWYEAGTTNVVDEVVNTYNFLGQIVRRESVPANVYCTFTYSFLGNNTLVNLYDNNVLVLKEEYTHRKFNRNPLTALNGIPVVLPYYDFVISNWWETSQKWTIYNDGIPEVIIDFDPNTAVMELGSQYFLTSVKNFDRAIQQNTQAIFQYENCGGSNNNKPATRSYISAAKNSRSAIIAKFKRSLLPGQSKDIKKEIKELKNKLRQ